MHKKRDWNEKRNLKRKATAICLCTVLTAGSGFSAAAFAASGDGGQDAENVGSTDTESVASETETQEKTVVLTLEDAVEKMKIDSTLSEQADFNRKQDEITAKSYTESVKTINSNLKALSAAEDLNTAYSLQQSGATKSNLKIAQLSRDFVTEHIDDNYEAEMNGIEQSAVSQYYTILLDQENVEVCESQLTYQKRLLSSAETKYSQGMISYDDLVTQQNAVSSAERDLNNAVTTRNSDMRKFNEDFGYDLDTQLVLTTSIEQVEESLPDVEEAVESALENSLELKYYTDYTAEKLELQFGSISSTTSKSSSSYKNAELSYEKSLSQIKEMTTAKEQSIRRSYDSLSKLEAQISAASQSLETAQRNYSSAQKKYELGLVSALSVESAKMSEITAQQSLNQAIVSYNCAVTQLKGDIGVGSSRITFS